MTLNVTLIPSDYGHFGYKFDRPAKTSRAKVITDTGCQSTLMGMDIVHRLGYKKTDLVQTKMHMVGIDKFDINIVGAIIL
jgi:hypothetical protein